MARHQRVRRRALRSRRGARPPRPLQAGERLGAGLHDRANRRAGGNGRHRDGGPRGLPEGRRRLYPPDVLGDRRRSLGRAHRTGTDGLRDLPGGNPACPGGHGHHPRANPLSPPDHRERPRQRQGRRALPQQRPDAGRSARPGLPERARRRRHGQCRGNRDGERVHGPRRGNPHADSQRHLPRRHHPGASHRPSGRRGRGGDRNGAHLRGLRKRRRGLRDRQHAQGHARDRLRGHPLPARPGRTATEGDVLGLGALGEVNMRELTLLAGGLQCRTVPRVSMRLLALLLSIALSPSAATAAGAVPFDDTWQEQRFSMFSSNRYDFGEDRLTVQSDGTVSLVWARLPEASWGVPPADLRRKGGDDRNLALYFVFLPVAEARAAGRSNIRRLLDADNARVLVYVWGGAEGQPRLQASPYLGPRGMTVALQPAGTGTADEAADLAADHRAAFGTAPGALVGVAVSADSDDTATVIRAEVADLLLR